MLHSIWAEGAEDQYVTSFKRYETYIPFRPRDLCCLIVNELSQHRIPDPVPEGLQALYEFNRRLANVMKLRVADRFDEWQDAYVLLDPDVDVLLRSSEQGDSEKISQRNKDFQVRLAKALKDSSFEKLTRRDFEEASNTQSILGLNVQEPKEEEIQRLLFVRGRRMSTIEKRNWKTLWLQKKKYDLKTYQRVLLLLCRDYDEEKDAFWAPARFIMNLFPHPPDSLSKSVVPGKMYLKIYKDIEMADVDMLIPGSKVKFTQLDYVLLIVPLLIGLISAITKAATGTLDFSSLANTMTSALLVVLPLVYFIRGYMGFRQKRALYNANLTRMLSLQAVASNSGAITALLDEVSDQETMDVLLAYAFLWRGQQNPPVMLRRSLDNEIEAFLATQLKLHKVHTSIQFTARAACDKLHALGLLQKNEVQNGEGYVQAVPYDQALTVLAEIDITKRQRSFELRTQLTTTSEFEHLDIVSEQ